MILLSKLIIGNTKGFIRGKALSTEGHTHTIAQVTSLQDTLNGKANALHTHTTSQVTGLESYVKNVVSQTGSGLGWELLSEDSINVTFSKSVSTAHIPCAIYSKNLYGLVDKVFVHLSYVATLQGTGNTNMTTFSMFVNAGFPEKSTNGGASWNAAPVSNADHSTFGLYYGLASDRSSLVQQNNTHDYFFSMSGKPYTLRRGSGVEYHNYALYGQEVDIYLDSSSTKYRESLSNVYITCNTASAYFVSASIRLTRRVYIIRSNFNTVVNRNPIS